MAAPQVLIDIVNSLHVDGVPGQAVPGDLISPRVVPDLSPGIAGSNPTLDPLTQTETIAEITADLKPILTYLAATLGLDTAAVLKAVEPPPGPASTTTTPPPHCARPGGPVETHLMVDDQARPRW